MPSIDPLVEDFLAQKAIAVAGVSRGGKRPANAIYSKLKGAGYRVYPVNPHAREIDGDPCYPDMTSLPARADGVVIATSAGRAAELVRQCVKTGVPRVWMHCPLGSTRSASTRWARGTTSVSEEAVGLCRENGIAVIAGACPMMFCKPVDPAHAIMRRVLRLLGGLRTWE